MSRFEIMQGEVSDIDDPDRRGRIKAKCRGMLAEGVALPDWIEPTFPWTSEGDAGWFFLPAVGTGVDLLIRTGSDNDDVADAGMLLAPEIRWIGALYTGKNAVPKEFAEAKTYGKRFGLKTPGGLLLMFDESVAAIVLKYGDLRLGSADAAEPLVLGNVFASFAGSLLDAIIGHTHLDSIGGATGAPVNIAAFQALKADPITSKAILADHAFTRKG